MAGGELTPGVESMKIKSFVKKAVCVALLAGALVGAANAGTQNLGPVTIGTPKSFNTYALNDVTLGDPITGIGTPFIDIFRFTLPANGGSGYSVIDVPISTLFSTDFTSATLVQGIPGTGTPLLTVGADANNQIIFNWGPNLGGAYYLSVSGVTAGTLGAAYSGSISVSAPPVPEPESYAMFLAGLGLMGVMVRRRIRRQS